LPFYLLPESAALRSEITENRPDDFNLRLLQAAGVYFCHKNLKGVGEMKKVVFRYARKLVLSGDYAIAQKVCETDVPRNERRKLRRRLKSSEKWQMAGQTVYNVYGASFDGIASWGGRVCVRLNGTDYRFDVLHLDRFGRRSVFLIFIGCTSKRLPDMNLSEGELQLLIQMADEISDSNSRREHVTELKNPLRSKVSERVKQWPQVQWHPEALLDLLEKAPALLSILTAALDSQLRTLKQLRAVPRVVYNFLLAKKNTGSLDWLIRVLQALTFANEASHLPGPIVTSDPDVWRKGFQRLTLLNATGPSLLQPILNELRTYDLQQKSGGQATLNPPTLPIAVSRSALCSPFVLDVELPTKPPLLSAAQQDLLRTAMGRVLSKKMAKTAAQEYAAQMAQPTSYRLSGYTLWREILTDHMCRTWFPIDPLRSRANALREYSQQQQEAQELQRLELLRNAYELLTSPERYADRIIDRPKSKATADDKLLDEAFAFCYDPTKGDQQGHHFLAFSKGSLARLLATVGLGPELFEAFLDVCETNRSLASRDQAITLNGSTFHAITVRNEGKKL